MNFLFDADHAPLHMNSDDLIHLYGFRNFLISIPISLHLVQIIPDQNKALPVSEWEIKPVTHIKYSTKQ